MSQAYQVRLFEVNMQSISYNYARAYHIVSYLSVQKRKFDLYCLCSDIVGYVVCAQMESSIYLLE